MRFSIAKREVEVGPGHVLLTVITLFVMIAATTAIVAVLALAMGGSDFFTAFIYANIWVVTAITIIFDPLIAYLLLAGGRLMKMKQDEAFCRSAAAAMSIVTGTAFVLVFGAFMLLAAITPRGPYSVSISYVFPFFGLPYMAGVVLGLAAGAVFLYLWLRIFIKRDLGGLKTVAAQAALFALGVLIVDESISFLVGYATGAPHALELGLATIKNAVHYFIFSLPIFYHTAGKKLDWEAAKFFAATYFGSVAALVAHNALLGSVPETAMAMSLLHPVVALALLYLLCRSKDVTL